MFTVWRSVAVRVCLRALVVFRAAALHTAGVTCWLFFRWRRVVVGRQVSNSEQVLANRDKWECEHSGSRDGVRCKSRRVGGVVKAEMSGFGQTEQTRKLAILKLYFAFSFPPPLTLTWEPDTWLEIVKRRVCVGGWVVMCVCWWVAWSRWRVGV